jgi:hypothetical protein
MRKKRLYPRCRRLLLLSFAHGATGSEVDITFTHGSSEVGQIDLDDLAKFVELSFLR